MNKPKYYKIRLYGPVVYFLTFMVSLQFVDTYKIKALIIAIFIVFALAAKKVFNPKEVQAYYKYESNRERNSMQEKVRNSSVNENIERYLHEQKMKKANAEWWQFWV